MLNDSAVLSAAPAQAAAILPGRRPRLQSPTRVTAAETIISTIRHARTQYNAEQRYAGSIDIPLSETGIRDARRAAGWIARRGYDVVVTSTLQRAWQTAALLAGDAVPVVRTGLCKERRFGILEGLTWEEVQHLQPPVLMIRVGNDLHTVNPRGGEPFEHVWQRAKAFRRYLLSNYNGQNVLVVSHGVFLQMFHGLLRGLNCIESLGDFPSYLELMRFRIRGLRLLQETAEKGDTATRDQW